MTFVQTESRDCDKIAYCSDLIHSYINNVFFMHSHSVKLDNESLMPGWEGRLFMTVSATDLLAYLHVSETKNRNYSTNTT